MSQRRKPQLGYAITALPDEVFAVIRLSWFKDGRPSEVNEMVLMEDGGDSFDAFHSIVTSALLKGANVAVSSAYKPSDLGIPS